MDKDSFEYRSWLAYVIGLALIFILIVACSVIYPPEALATRRTFPGMIIGVMIIWLSAAFTGYSRAQAMYQKRLSGWTPLELNPREGFFTSRLIKLIQKIRGK